MKKKKARSDKNYKFTEKKHSICTARFVFLCGIRILQAERTGAGKNRMYRRCCHFGGVYDAVDFHTGSA